LVFLYYSFFREFVLHKLLLEDIKKWISELNISDEEKENWFLSIYLVNFDEYLKNELVSLVIINLDKHAKWIYGVTGNKTAQLIGKTWLPAYMKKSVLSPIFLFWATLPEDKLPEGLYKKIKVLRAHIYPLLLVDDFKMVDLPIDFKKEIDKYLKYRSSQEKMSVDDFKTLLLLEYYMDFLLNEVVILDINLSESAANLAYDRLRDWIHKLHANGDMCGFSDKYLEDTYYPSLFWKILVKLVAEKSNVLSDKIKVLSDFIAPCPPNLIFKRNID